MVENVREGGVPDSREARLEWVLRRLAQLGVRIESRPSADTAIVAYGKPMSTQAHFLHAFLTLMTIFVWSIVWIALWKASAIRRRLLEVDEKGLVHATEFKLPDPNKPAAGAHPEKGKVVSQTGAVGVDAGKRRVTFDPGLRLYRPTRVVCGFVGSAAQVVGVGYVLLRFKTNTVEVQFSGPAPADAVLRWFVMN
jgi:hypothetical protein